MQKITTFLTYNDRAEEAVNFYTSIFKNSQILDTRRGRTTTSSCATAARRSASASSSLARLRVTLR